MICVVCHLFTVFIWIILYIFTKNFSEIRKICITYRTCDLMDWQIRIYQKLLCPAYPEPDQIIAQAVPCFHAERSEEHTSELQSPA